VFLHEKKLNTSLYLNPLFQPGTPPYRPYEAPTPGSGWASTTGVGFGENSEHDDSGQSLPLENAVPSRSLVNSIVTNLLPLLSGSQEIRSKAVTET
jgi:transcription elongation factor SPT5